MTVGQLALFDLTGPDPEPVREWSPPEIDGECEHCGTPISSRNPMDSVNHGPMDGTCTTRALTRVHALQAQRRLTPEGRSRSEREQCNEHYGTRKKPCPQEHFDAEYEDYAARATEVWGGHGWKVLP